MMTEEEKKYEEYKRRFQALTDEELSALLKEDRKKPGWVSSRSIFLRALNEEIEERKRKGVVIRDLKK